MERYRDPSDAVRGLNQELLHCIQHTCPSRQFHAELMLGALALELYLRQLRHCQDLAQRRRLKQELNQGIVSLRQGIKLLWRSRREKTASLPSPRSEDALSKRR